MGIYFSTFQVVPEPDAVHLSNFNDALAHVWIKEKDIQSATVKCRYLVGKHGWKIVSIDTPVTAVSSEDFEDVDLGRKCFEQAVNEGASTFYLVDSDDETLHSDDPQELVVPAEVDMAKVLGIQKATRDTGRCLHYGAGSACNSIIAAHSIQRGGVLTAIARDGMVYSPSSNMGDMKRNNGLITLRLCGINKVSTFRGFCKKHDNELFRAIDDFPFEETREQACLYAYRFLCREVFAKQSVIESIKQQVEISSHSKATRDLLNSVKKGNEIGLRHLNLEKSRFESCIRKKKFRDVRYLSFETQMPPNIVFSGGIFPDFGFCGERIQDLSLNVKKRSFVTFSYAKKTSGWAFLFAWHKSSEPESQTFVRTIANSIHRGDDLGGQLLGLILAGCENIGVSPVWFEALTAVEVAEISKRMSLGSDVQSVTPSNYLSNGPSNLADWNFSAVIDSESRTLASRFRRVKSALRNLF